MRTSCRSDRPEIFLSKRIWTMGILDRFSNKHASSSSQSTYGDMKKHMLNRRRTKEGPVIAKVQALPVPSLQMVPGKFS